MPDDSSILPKLLVLIVLILVNAFFAAAEIAVISLSETKLKKQAEGTRNDRRKTQCLRNLLTERRRLCGSRGTFILLRGGMSRNACF